MERLMKGLEILKKHGADMVCAEHDIIYVGGEDIPEDFEGAAELKELGGWTYGENGWAYFT